MGTGPPAGARCGRICGRTGRGVILGEADLATGLAILQIATLAVLVIVLRRWQRLRRRVAVAEDLGGDIALLVEGGRVVATSEDARRMLGAVERRPLRMVLETFLGAGARSALEAFDRVSRSGVAERVAVTGSDGRPMHIAIAPRGGRLRVALHELDPPTARERGQKGENSTPTEVPAEDGSEVAAAVALLERAPVLTWRREADGRVSWSQGRIETDVGTVEAEAAATMASRAQPGNGQGTDAGADGEWDGARRFRLEIAAGGNGGVVALDAIEVPADDGAVLGLALDASAHQGAEHALARFVQTMTETFAHLNVGLAIFDRSQSLVLFNPALAEMWQTDPAWLAGRPSLREVLDRLRSSRRLPEVADFRAWRERLTALFDDPEVADYEELWHLTDGSDIRVLARPHPHGSLAFVFDDVTEHLRLEQRFQHEVEVRRVTLDRLDEGVAVFRPDGLLQFVNAAFHGIWDVDDDSVRPQMHARDLLPLMSGLAVETDVWPRLLGFITGEEAREPWSVRLTLGNGRVLDAHFTALPDGATMATFTDVTAAERIGQALAERNAALEAAEEIRSAVLDQISYRLRTPLNTIFGFGQLLVDPSFGPLSDSQRHYAEQILESARSLLAAVDEVTGLAALETGPIEPAAARPVLAEALAFAGRLLEKRAMEADVQLRLEVPEEDLAPACDPLALRQILFRVGTAAIASAAPGSEVSLSARRGRRPGVELIAWAAPPGDRPPAAELGARGPELTYLKRLVAGVGGELVIGPAAGDSMIEIRCTLPLATADSSGEVASSDGHPIRGEAGGGSQVTPATGTG